MKPNKNLQENRWILLQQKNGRYHLVIIKDLFPSYIIAVNLRDELLYCPWIDISNVIYKPNLYIIQSKKVKEEKKCIDAFTTYIVEAIKNTKSYNLILTNKKKITKSTKIFTKKIKKETLAKKAYAWLKQPKEIKKFTPILFFQDNNLSFLIIMDHNGYFKFIDQNFKNIKKFKIKKLNIILKKTRTIYKPKRNKLKELAEKLL